MYRLSNLPSEIPIFPLEGALLLPHSRLPLNIFEPRYLSMVDDVLKTEHRLIGMVQPKAGQSGLNTPDLQGIGCAGRLTSFTETSDRRYMITLTGIARFRITDLHDGFLPYRQASTLWDSFAHDLRQTTIGNHFDRPRFLALLERYFQIMNLSADWESLKDADDTLLINSLAMMCPFEAEEKQALLVAKTDADRYDTLMALMEFALREGDADNGKLQ